MAQRSAKFSVKRNRSSSLLKSRTNESGDARELQQISRDLKKSVVKALADGTILKLDLRNSGKAVYPGDAIAQIALRDANLVVKTPKLIMWC